MAEVFESGGYESGGGEGSSSKRKRTDVTGEKRKKLEIWERDFGDFDDSDDFGSDEPSYKRQRKNLETADVAGTDESFVKSERFFLWPGVPVVEPEILDLLWKASIFRCKDALKELQINKGLNYELVELVSYDCVPSLYPYKRWHFNFKAKKGAVSHGKGIFGLLDPQPPLPIYKGFKVDRYLLRNDAAAAADDDGSLKLFYADLCETNRGRHRLISLLQCEILDPSDPGGDCPYCESVVLHPENMVDFVAVEPFWIPADPLPRDEELVPSLAAA